MQHTLWIQILTENKYIIHLLRFLEKHAESEKKMPWHFSNVALLYIDNLVLF
jgi:hypothetical protein